MVRGADHFFPAYSKFTAVGTGIGYLSVRQDTEGVIHSGPRAAGQATLLPEATPYVRSHWNGSLDWTLGLNAERQKDGGKPC